MAVLLALPVPGTAHDDLAMRFSRCLGQMSAEREHTWLIQGDGLAEIEDRWHAFASLVDATLREADRPRALHHRIEAKHMHAALLQQAYFDTDETRARAARRLTGHRREACLTLLLDS
jgi:hypothetical protein